jgi:hypothetical protein
VTAPRYTKFAAPRFRRSGAIWRWAVTDGIGGSELVTGIALTAWGRDRRIDRALRRCEPDESAVTE